MLSAAEIAAAVVALCQPDAAGTNGAAILLPAGGQGS
jgi:hypothetical protein